MAELIEEFKGLIILAMLPGAAAAGYLALILIEAARAGRPGGRRVREERKKRK